VRAALIASSRAAGTVKAYAFWHLRALEGCRFLGINPSNPLSELDLCDLTVWFCCRWSLNSLRVFIAAVRDWQQRDFNVADLPRSHAYEAVRRGLTKLLASIDAPRPKHPMTEPLLLRLVEHLDLSRFSACRSWAMSLFAFYGVFRISEYATGRLRMEDVCVFRLASGGWAVQVTIQFSKTDDSSSDVVMVARSDALCPVRAWLRYRFMLHSSVRSNPKAAAFVSSPSSTAAVSTASFGAFIKRAASVLHLNPDDYAGHSFRRGGATAMFSAKVPESSIKDHGRWKSEAFRRYIHISRDMKAVPTATLATSARSSASGAPPPARS
jgi:hypothetical protein